MSVDFADNLATRLEAYGDRPFIEFARKWYAGNEITDFIERVSAALTEAGVQCDEPVGIVVRNRVAHAAAILGFIASRRPVVMIYSYQSPTAIARDVADLALPAVLADLDDWTPELHGAVASSGSAISETREMPAAVVRPLT